MLCVAIAGAAPDFSLPQYLSIQSATSPSPDPASQEVLYVSNITGVAQVWKMSAFSGYQTQVTFDTNGVGRAWWSPRDKDLMVVSAAVGGSERWQLYLTNPSGGPWNRVTSNDSAIYTFGDWSRDGSRFAYSTNARNKKDFDVYEYNVDAAHHFLLYQGEGQNDAANYSPDHRYLLIVRQTSNANSNLLLYDRANGKTRLFTKHSGDVVYRNPVWDGNGKGFYFLTDQGRDFVGLAYWPLDSAAFRWVDTPEQDVEEVAISPDGEYLAWTTNDAGYSNFNFQNLRRGTRIPPHRTPQGIIRGLTFAQDNGQLMFTFSGPTRPTDIWTYETAADRLHQITAGATGGIPTATLRAPDLIEYESFDGRHIPAFWFTPADVTGPMPVIVMAHGGPEAQARPALNGLYQYFLSRGYAILEPNVRGSNGYGKAYSALDNGRKRMDSVKDYEFAARWLKTQPQVDSTRLVIYGGSYGGFIALASLVNAPQTWAAGVSLVGHHELRDVSRTHRRVSPRAARGRIRQPRRRSRIPHRDFTAHPCGSDRSAAGSRAGRQRPARAAV